MICDRSAHENDHHRNSRRPGRPAQKLAKLCTEADQARDGATTHGPLTVPALLAMLAEDAGMVLTRPGSWEGSNMDTVFSSHGYQL